MSGETGSVLESPTRWTASTLELLETEARVAVNVGSAAYLAEWLAARTKGAMHPNIRRIVLGPAKK